MMIVTKCMSELNCLPVLTNFQDKKGKQDMFSWESASEATSSVEGSKSSSSSDSESSSEDTGTEETTNPESSAEDDTEK